MSVSLDLETEVLIEEYRSLRAEINQRVQNQLYIIGGNLALLAAAFQLILPDLAKGKVTTLTLLCPFVFYVVAWLYFEQDVFLTQAATYLHQRLRPAILNRVQHSSGPATAVNDILGWEDFRNAVLFRQRTNRVFLKLMTAFRLLATLGPGVAILGAIVRVVILDKTIAFHSPVLWYFLYGFNLVALGVLIYLALHVIYLYSQIGVSLWPVHRHSVTERW